VLHFSLTLLPAPRIARSAEAVATLLPSLWNSNQINLFAASHSHWVVYKVHFHRLQVASTGHKTSYMTPYSNITYKNTKNASIKTYIKLISASYNTFLAGCLTMSLQFIQISMVDKNRLKVAILRKCSLHAGSVFHFPTTR